MTHSKTRKAFEAPQTAAARVSFKHAVFLYEAAAVPDDLRVCCAILEAFAALPESRTTLLISGTSIDESAAQIDTFKNKNCGSGFSLAIFNLNNFDTLEELQFLLRKDVLGNPRSIFMGTLKHSNGPVYTHARQKVAQEDELRFGAPSCIDSYTAANRHEVPPRIARLAAAYLQDADERARVGRESSVLLQRTSPALEELFKIPSAFYGTRLKRK